MTPSSATRRVFWAAVWLAIVLAAIKAYYLGIPARLALTDTGNYVRSLAAIEYISLRLNSENVSFSKMSM